MSHAGPGRRGRSVVLWIVAVVLMLGTASYQRATGPTRPLRGEYSVGTGTYAFQLLRAGSAREQAAVRIPVPGSDISGKIFYRNTPNGSEFTSVDMVADGENLVGHLPPRPPVEKLEYHLVLRTADAELRVPSEERGNVVIRFKDPVPAWVLAPHVILMFIGVLLAIRAGLAALFAPGDLRGLAWKAFWAIGIGGLAIGPFVSAYAFHLPWTGVPFGWDVTDNKTLLMWLAWLVAGVAVRRSRPASGPGDAPVGVEAVTWRGRLVVLVAAIVTVVVYLIPHSV